MSDQASGTERDPLTDKIIGAAIEVHRHIGPGVLESTYEECLAYELTQAKLSYDRQQILPLVYKGIKLEQAYRLDLVVEKRVIVEIKAVDKLLPIHEAQLLTYLRLRQMQVGLLLNFHTPVLKQGIKRMVLSQ